MIDFLKGWILNIVTLVMVIVLLEILIPSGRLKKYVSLVTGFILVIALINPFIGILGKGIKLGDLQLANSNSFDRKEIQRNSKVLEEEQMRQIAEVYRKKLIKQIEDTAAEETGGRAVKADVIINDDYKSEKFGEIKRVYIYTDSEGSEIKPVVQIDRIKVGEKTSDEKTVENNGQVDAKLRKKLEDRITGLFGINREIIVISQEGS